MDKKTNILGRALAKLNLMQKQLVEESQVLDELKEQEDADRRELEALRSELCAKSVSIESLKEELGKRDSEIRRLAAGIEKSSAEFKNALDRERSDARFNYGKLEAGAAEAEKRLEAEAEALRESLRQKTAEASRSGAEVKSLLGSNEQLKDDYEGRLKELQAANDSLAEGARKQKSGIENLFSELRNQAAEFNALLDKERAEDKTARTNAQKEIRELNAALKTLQHEQQKLTAEAEKLRDENAEVKTLRDSALVKIMEMEMFSKSATSALKESRLELELLEKSKKELSDELSKDKADFRRRLELARLELEEKKRQLDRLTRALDAAKTENVNLKAELAGQEKKKE